jgi:GMP synthase (glutamine-hydrolysing)
LVSSLAHEPPRVTASQHAPVLCIEQQSNAHLGRLRPLLRAAGVQVIERPGPNEDLARVELDRWAGIISLGGEMGAHDGARYPFLAPEIDLLERAHAEGVPVLGICLGAQLLATALGGTVTPGGCHEVGWLEVDVVTDDPLLGPARRTRQFQWHSDAFDLPPGAELIATSPAWATEAYRLGTSYGLQFHPEVDASLVRAWATEEGGRAELQDLGIDSGRLLADADEFDGAYKDQARRLASGFAELVRGAADGRRLE